MNDEKKNDNKEDDGQEDDGKKWEELIDCHLRGELSGPEKERLAEWLDSDSEARRRFVEYVQFDTTLSETLRDSQGAKFFVDRATVSHAMSGTKRAHANPLRWMLVIAAILIVALSAGLIYELFSSNRQSGSQNRVASSRRSASPSIARITGLSGALMWTGDRGEIVRDITVGTELAGGTIEGLAPDSWFELQFRDGSTVMISGTSLLTFADVDQKKLRLREGRLSASVEPQPVDKPMLIQTRSALLRVLGTQFDVEADLASTMLSVSEGRVNLMRLSDGREVDVIANHQVTTDDDEVLLPAPKPASVHQWKSQLHLKPENYGKWQAGDVHRPASLKAIPLIPPENPDVTLYLAGLSVDRSSGSPVVLLPESKLIVRGRLRAAAPVYFGIRVTYSNGEFAGMFRGDLLEKQATVAIGDEGRFEEVYQLQQFTVDPAVYDRREELAAKPDGLILDGVWAFTHTSVPSGLEITEIELVPSGESSPFENR